MAQKFDYNKFKKEALEFQGLQQKVDLSEIEITDNGQLIVSGVTLRTADNVFHELLKILKLQPGFIKRFGETFSDKASIELINIIRQALVLKNHSKNDSKNLITIVGDNKSNQVTHILPGHRDIISNEIALSLFEKAFDSDGKLEIIDGKVDGSALSLTVRKNIEVVPEIEGKRLLGEEFNPGFNFKNSLLQGASIESYMERLICENGMTAKNYFGDIEVKRLEDGEIQQFFKDFLAIQKLDFVSSSYAKNIDRANNTNASFAELSRIKNTMINNSAITEKDLYSFLPEWQKEINRLAAHNIDYKDCSFLQLQNHPVRFKMWDLINKLTDFGSHDYGYAADNISIQREAGLILTKKDYDSSNVILLS